LFVAEGARVPAFTPLVDSEQAHTRLVAVAELASVAVTCVLLWLVASAGFPFSLSPAGFFIVSLGCSCLAWISSAVIGAGLYLFFSPLETAEFAGSLRGAANTAVWSAPAAVLLANASPGVLLAGAILVVSCTRLLYSHWAGEGDARDGCEHGRPGARTAMFGGPLPAAPPWWRAIGPSWATAFAGQTGAAAAALRYPLVSALMMAVAASGATALLLSAGWSRPGRTRHSRRQASAGAAAAIVLASLLATVGMVARMSGVPAASLELSRSAGRSPSKSALDAVRAAMSVALYEGKQEARPAAGKKKEPALEAGALGGDFPGVVLWPEVREIPIIVEPVPVGGLTAGIVRRPIGIPFGGEYWLYRLPNRRPPGGSHFERANPAERSFRTVDQAPLEMEARQDLGQYIPVKCCREIRVEIWNADPHPGTVSLEMFLTDSRRPTFDGVSLGEAPAVSAPPKPEMAAYETLRYSMPAPPELRRFDGFRVAFRLQAVRKDRSARIAVDRFILVPK
jgi:hypothetical protein